jgi:tripartite ATP-independent transporter DctM subunit
MFLLFLITIAIMYILGFPIYLGLLGASLIYIGLNPQLSMLIAMEKMLNAANSFTLLAVPFFIFAGQVMNTGGITSRIFKFTQALVGQFRGGLGYVNVVASIIFSGMSGSALADMGGLGLIEINAMREQGYDDDFSIGLTAASGIIGPIIPPSIPFVLFGAIANVSVGALFIGGIVPGLLMGVVLSVAVFIISKKRGYPAFKRATLREIWDIFLASAPALMTPVIIIGGIWTGWFTPTEAAFVSVVYALLVAMLVYKDITIKHLPDIILSVIKMVAPTIIIVVTAALFGWIIIYEKVDQVFLQFLTSVTDSRTVVLLIINIILLLFGMFLDVASSMLILIPIFMPVIRAFGINPVHLGVFMVINQMIGLLTPPVGSGINILSTVCEKSFEETTKILIPWLVPLLITLFMVTYIPETVLFLPRLLGFVK